MREMDFERGIWHAALHGNVEKLENHLKNGTHPGVKDSSGYTALVGEGGYTSRETAGIALSLNFSLLY